MTWLHDYYININMYGPHFAAIKKDDGRTTLPKVINIEYEKSIIIISIHSNWLEW